MRTFRDLEGNVGVAPTRVDLGMVRAADLVNGPQTLYTPSAGQAVQLMFDEDSLTLCSPIECSVVFTYPSGIEPDGITNLLAWLSSNAKVSMRSPVVARIGPAGEPIQAALSTGFSSFTVGSALVAWQANHAYAEFDLIIGPDDHIWSASAGTSDSSIPDFAGNEDGTVDDNDITWTDEGHIPTAGGVHVYAIVS